jgi:DNA-binding XRE family transcriptional regulator
MVNSPRRIRPNYRRFRSSTHLLIKTAFFSVRFTVEGRLTMRQRRAIALALARDNLSKLECLRETRILHSDGDFSPLTQDYWRGISLAQAPTLASDNGKLGVIIRIRRLALGLTQAELARLAGLTRTHLSRIERGHFLPLASNVYALEKVLGVTLPHFERISHRTIAH